MGMTLQIDESGERRGLGWLPDHPDLRDLTANDKSVKSMLKKTSVPQTGGDEKTAGENGPPSLVFADRGTRAASAPATAHAGVGMIEYLERRAFGKHIDASRRFLYKVTREPPASKATRGRSCATRWARCGSSAFRPRSYWPYVIAEFDKEPPAFCYAFGQNFQATTYYRLDPFGDKPEKPPRLDQGPHRIEAPGDVRLHRLPVDLDRERRHGPLPLCD